MNTIVEVAGYVLLGTVLFGSVITFFLLRAYWYQPSPVAPHPAHIKLPTLAVDAVKEALQKANRQHAASTGKEKERLSFEVRRLETRLEKLEQQTFDEHRDYNYALRLRESAWLQWKELHDRASFTGKRLDSDTRELLKEAKWRYNEAHRNVENERHTAVARDLVNLEEIRGQEVLTQSFEEESSGTAEDTGTVEDTATADTEAVPDSDTLREAEAVPDADGFRLSDFADPSIVKSGKRYLDAYFELAGINGGILREADLSETDFTAAEFRGLHIHINCNFSRANLSGIRLARHQRLHQFAGCDFSGAHFTSGKLSYVVFSQCDFSRTHWGGAKLDHIKFMDCRMEEVFWEQVDLSLTLMPPDMAAQLDFSDASAPPRTPTVPGSAAPPLQPKAPPPQALPPQTPSDAAQHRGGEAAEESPPASNPDPAGLGDAPSSESGDPTRKS